MKINNFDLEKDGTYIIAELSANHGNSLQTALDSIKATKEVGVSIYMIYTKKLLLHTLSIKNYLFMQKRLILISSLDLLIKKQLIF